MLKPESGLYWSISCLQTKPQQSLNVVNVPHLIWITALSWAQHIIDKVRFTFTLTWIIRNNWLVSSSPPSPHSTLQSLGIINNRPCDRSGSDGWINLTQLNGLFKTNINYRGVIRKYLSAIYAILYLTPGGKFLRRAKPYPWLARSWSIVLEVTASNYRVLTY